MEYIEQFFDTFDVDGNGYLNMKQTRRFFETVLDLDQKKNKHRRAIRQIFLIVDPENEKKIVKERILDFFRISGFKIIAKLCREQMELDGVHIGNKASIISAPSGVTTTAGAGSGTIIEQGNETDVVAEVVSEDDFSNSSTGSPLGHSKS